MKTKHILTALALPALLAACNNDEFESMNFEQAQSERPLLSEDFVLKMGFEGADTRYAVEGDGSLDFKFTDGDQLGAAIIDVYDYNLPIEDWEVIYSLAGNNPFTYNANADEWKSATRLGIGHYLYVYPYSPEDNNRAAVSYSLPTIQELYQTEDGAVDLNAAIEKGNKAVYSNILDEGNQTLEASLKNLYAYPKFVINFDNGQNVTSVSKVVLEYDNGEGFAVKGGFNHKDVADWFADPKTDWKEVQTKDLIIDKDDDDFGAAQNYTTIDYSKYLIAKLPKNAKVQTNSVTNNKYIEVRFMMPSAKMTYSGTAYTGDYAEALNMYIYTNNGVYQIKNVFDNIVFKDTTPVELKERVFARTTSFTLNMKNLTSANKVDDNLNIVTNVEDWNNLVSAYGSFEKFTATAPLKVAVVGEDFTLNASAKMPSKAIFEITTEVKVEGEVTLSNVKVTNTVTVEEHATLTTSGSFTAKKVENNGTMNIAVATNKDGDVVPYSGVGEIENNGTLNIAKDAKATFALVNTKGAVVTNNGEITISGDNSGEINNEAIIKTTGFTNNKPADAKKDPMPTINNAADARIMAQSDKLINNALIVNKGSITCKNMGGEIVNNGDLDSKETALTYITDNTNGTIIVYSENTTNLTIGKGEGVVEYTTDKTSVDFTNSLVNTVIASKDLTVTGKRLASVTFEKTAALTLGKGGYVDILNVNGGITTVKSNMDVTTLNVAKGAQITVPEKITLTVTGDAINNQGRILVGGIFNAKKMQSTEEGVGTVEDNGNGEINWELSDEAQAIEAAKQAYNTALTAMVDAWMLDGSRVDWESVYNMAAGSWVNNGDWGTLISTTVEKYNELQKLQNGETVTETEFATTLLNNEAKSIIDEYKTYGDSKRGEAIAKVYTDNSWVTTTVYQMKKADAKLTDIVDGSSNKMVDAFAGKINAITGVTISKKAIENKAIKLSLNAVTGETVVVSWVPAYSYIETYATAEVYKAIKMWKEVTEKYANATSSLVPDWFKKANEYRFATKNTDTNTMARMKSFYNEINKVDTTGDLLLGQELEPLKAIAKTVVLEWNYTKEQIQTLSATINDL